MNPRTRKAALYAIGVIALLASMNALAHSYAGLYGWALHHRLAGWQAMSWPAEIDVFLAVGELALYVAYLDGWPVRQRIWPWATALTGLSVSIAGNIGHIQAAPGQPVIMADRLTAATSPVAAFAGLAIGLLVLKMTRTQGTSASAEGSRPTLTAVTDPGAAAVPGPLPAHSKADNRPDGAPNPEESARWPGVRAEVLSEANAIRTAAATRGERLSQRALARQLRERGHRFPNDQLHQIAEAAARRFFEVSEERAGTHEVASLHNDSDHVRIQGIKAVAHHSARLWIEFRPFRGRVSRGSRARRGVTGRRDGVVGPGSDVPWPLFATLVAGAFGWSWAASWAA